MYSYMCLSIPIYLPPYLPSVCCLSSIYVSNLRGNAMYLMHHFIFLLIPNKDHISLDPFHSDELYNYF